MHLPPLPTSPSLTQLELRTQAGIGRTLGLISGLKALEATGHIRPQGLSIDGQEKLPEPDTLPRTSFSGKRCERGWSGSSYESSLIEFEGFVSSLGLK